MAHNPDVEPRPHTVITTNAAAQFIATDQPEREAELDAEAHMCNSLPINDNCIRLLQVRSRDGASGNDAPLDCQLYVTDLTSRSSNAALSYVWGVDVSSDWHNLCNGVVLLVTSNCYSALRHLHVSNSTYDIWVDAISTKQKYQDEKMDQINPMGDIYPQPNMRYVWLGPGDAATN
jgi:hypothetical protein